MILNPDPPEFPAAWAVAWGEDAFGRWQAFQIGGVRQVMRWIPPGEFMMGSPQDEPERWARAGPQHRVTLRRGYWLADTACTQALWRAVMGENPARFDEDPENPVEDVSWDDCQNFIERAKAPLPDGPGLRLPSEAEWEYACRAGTDTPFWWGSTLSTEQANFVGRNPYAGGKKEESRGRTVPVLSFEANPWGLYQVHGNVWEWCADRFGDYPAEPVNGARRTVRAGKRSAGKARAGALRANFELNGGLVTGL